MKTLGLQGVRRAKGIRTTIPSKDGVRAGDLLNRDFTAAAPNTVWVTDFTYVRTWAGWTYVAFIVDVFSQRIVAWHAATNKEVDLVMTPLRIALWQRDRDGHPVGYKELIHHSDAGSQYTSIRLTDTSAWKGSVPRSGPSETPTTTRSWKRSTACTRRMRPHHGLPPRPVQDDRGRGVCDFGLGRLVQQPATAQ